MSLDFNEPVPVIAFPAPNLGPNKKLFVKFGTEQFFIQVTIPEGMKLSNWLTCFRHNPPCEKKLRRPHSICAHCLYQKRAKGKIQEFEPVKPIIWFYRNKTMPSPIRRWLIKKLQEALEFISDA